MACVTWAEWRIFATKDSIVALLAHNADINTLVGRTFTAENVQKMLQLTDAANLIVIDTLINHQDRFGNIHSPAWCRSQTCI